MSEQLNPQRTLLARTSLGESEYRLGPVYIDPEIIRFPEALPTGQSKTTVFLQGSYFRSTQIRSWSDVDVTVAFPDQAVEVGAEEYVRSLSERLCEKHPDISTDASIFAGNPHIKNVRLTVANVLAKIYTYGSIKAVADIYGPHVSEYQIREAIAYAQDFLEAAVHPNASIHSLEASEGND